MAKKRNIKSALTTSLVALIGVLTVSSFATAVFSVVSAALVIDTMPSFQSTVGDNVFYCYKISGAGYEDKVAVAWGKDPSATPDDTLEIPQTLYSDNSSDTTPYTVAAIANSAFHRCDFKYVSLPETVEEIGKGAFAYCEKLADIRIPHLVDKIQPSTFVSCRGLKTITYSENIAEEGQTPVYAPTSTNTIITRIEDHAFDSCVSLIQFECPKSLVYIGKSAFQNCNKITRFYLPENSTYGNITIDSYAFADCKSLNWVYFEENLTTVNDYAFIDCKDTMLFHYAYDTSGGAQSNPEFSTYWRRKSLNSGNSAVYDFEDASSIIRSADGYPGLKVAIDTRPIMLNSWKSTSDSASNTVQLDPGTGGYAVIYQWDNPGKTVRKTGDDFDYYNVGDGTDGNGILTIPHTVEVNGTDYPIKVIAEEAFKEITDFKEIHFKSKMVDGNLHGVVQIQKYAFQDCTNVEVIDFDGLTSLKEIGQSIFNTAMPNITSLKLPASLQYIGPYAFKDFRNVSVLSFTTPDDDTNSRLPSLRVIAHHAFTNIGASLTGTNYLHITLPCSLDDSYVKNASMNDGGSNWAAVGPYAFSGENKVNNRIATVTMATCNHTSNPNHNSVKTSFATNAFDGSNKLVRFTANKNLCYIGSNAFVNCGALKEVFLTTAKAAATNKICWGTSNGGGAAGDSIFGSSSCSNLVIYLDGNVPSKINSHSTSDTSGKAMWNSSGASYYNLLGYSSSYTGRKTIPTFTSVDFTKINETSIIYYKPSNRTTLSTSPSTDNDYFQGIIAFVKQGSSYVVARYYTNNTNATAEINLTGITHTYSGGTVNISANLTKIGPEAFGSDSTGTGATDQAPCPGKYFVLPTTVTTIEERAFYRKAVADNASTQSTVEARGVAIVTTDNNGTPLGGLDTTYAAVKTDFDTNKYGYCNIPNVTYIGNDAFYNNLFKGVELATGLAHLGRSVFYNRVCSKLTDISFVSANSTFEIINNGIYYTANENKKALLYQLQDVSGVAGSPKTLTIDDGTKAVGPTAVTRTGYEKIELVSGLTQIYGSSFQDNKSLVTLGIKSENSYDLEYIGANPYRVTAYKIEKYKYLLGTGTQTEHVDDLSHFGTIVDTSTPSGPKVNVSFVEEGNVTSLWPYLTTTGVTVYANAKPVGTETLIYQVPFSTDDTDVLGLEDGLPFDLVDYFDTINPNVGNTRNRNNTFRGCSSLKMVDFRSMTKLKKIGHAAFKGCTELMNVEDLGHTYNYYKYTKSTHTVSAKDASSTNVKSKVLDLSQCTDLVSIGCEAFQGCTNIKYAHLPFTDGRLFVQFDPHTDNAGITNKVFDNNGITILVGDKEIRANGKTHSKFGGLTKHYPADWQGSNPIYYYAPDGGAKSLYANQTAVKYWTQNLAKDPNGYILFEDYYEAKDYFDNIGSVVWPS